MKHQGQLKLWTVAQRIGYCTPSLGTVLTHQVLAVLQRTAAYSPKHMAFTKREGNNGSVCPAIVPR